MFDDFGMKIPCPIWGLECVELSKYCSSYCSAECREKKMILYKKLGADTEKRRALIKQSPPQYQIQAKNTTMGEPGILHPSTSVCIILRKHHEILKDDPERLSTDFIKSLSCIDKEKCTEVGD